MAHTKAKGSTQLGRDSKSKRLGVKIFGNQKVKNGQIIVRQRGTKYIAGENAKTGKDHTIFASTDGIVQFKKINKKTFSGKTKKRQLISIK